MTTASCLDLITFPAVGSGAAIKYYFKVPFRSSSLKSNQKVIGFSHCGHDPTALGGRHNLSENSYYCIACKIYGCVEVMTAFLTQQFSHHLLVLYES